jgi:biopolymer transport protein ExbD
MYRSLADPALRRRPRRRGRADPLIALINVVFLLLIFLMVAGTIAPMLDREIELIDTRNPMASTPPDAAVIRPDGSMTLNGAAITPEMYARTRLADGETALRIVPDRNLPAKALVELVATLRAAGASEIWIVTERVPR